MTAVVVLVLVLTAVVLAAAWAVGSANALSRLRDLIGEAWRQVDDELQRRYDLVPGLVAAVPAAADQGSACAAVLAARALAMVAGVRIGERADREGALTEALGRLFEGAAASAAAAALEQNEDFVALRRELRETEQRISAGRRIYNPGARELNGRLRSRPAAVVARACRVAPADYFEPSRLPDPAPLPPAPDARTPASDARTPASDARTPAPEARASAVDGRTPGSASSSSGVGA